MNATVHGFLGCLSAGDISCALELFTTDAIIMPPGEPAVTGMTGKAVISCLIKSSAN